MLPARALFKLHDIITLQHIDKMAKIILLTARSFPMPMPWNFFLPGTAAINMSASPSGTAFSGRIGGTGG